MPWHYKIIPEENLVVNTLADPFDMNEYLALMEAIMSSKRFKPSMHMLWDFRQSTLSKFSTDDINNIRKYVELNRERRGDGYRVVFLVKKAVDFGLSRMYQIVSEDLPVTFKVFYDEKEAFNWIKGKTQ
jgi:hypothetical protein